MIRGRYFDAQRSAPQEATLDAAPSGQWLLAVGGQTRLCDPVALKISDRIGSIPRRVHFPEGAEFETPDNDGIDALLDPARGARHGWVHALERRWGVALASLVAIALISVLFLRFGLPAIAGWAADRLPPEADRLIGRQSLEILDNTVFGDSGLDPQRQAQLQNLFARMTHPLEDGHAYRLELRGAPGLGPNALALPSGIIVMTDELVQIAKNDAELMAVLAHEIGHVRGRHSLRQIILSAGVSALAVAILGDLSSISAIASSAPVLLHTKHSRDFEREADTFARGWLDGQGIPEQRFDDILCRMTGADEGRQGEAMSFLSTHPATGERARCTLGSP